MGGDNLKKVKTVKFSGPRELNFVQNGSVVEENGHKEKQTEETQMDGRMNE